jgi:hypothetical protein
MNDPRARAAATRGPVQVLLIGIDRPGAEEMIAAELQDLQTQSAIRVVDLLRVRRDPGGELRSLPSTDPAGPSGRLVEALLYERTAGTATPPPGEEGRWSLAERIPRGSAVAILLVEHRWAVPLREAADQLEAEIFGDAWVHPRDLESASRQARPAER